MSVDSKRETPPSPSLRFGWIGLGQMGAAHVANLLQAGFQVCVWNRSEGPCATAVALGASQATSPRDVVATCDITFVMLSTPEVARLVYSQAEGVLAGVTHGKGVVDCASLDANTMRELANLVRAKGALFCAAPVCGHSGQARDASCQFLCAGDATLYEQVVPLLQAMSKAQTWLGEDVGAASNLKLVVNGLLGDIVASMAEAMALTEKAGLDQKDLMTVVGGHKMNSPLLQLCAKTMMNNQHPALFQTKLMAKDTKLAASLHAQLGRPSPMTSAAQQAFATAVEDGHGNSNFTSVYESMKTKQT